MKRILTFGGGTFSHIRSHLALAAPAFGSTAKQINGLFNDYKCDFSNELYLTKMADSDSTIITNKDLELRIFKEIGLGDVKVIVMNAAVCDFDPVYPNSGKYGERLLTSDGDVNITLTPAAKIISKIRINNPEIFLVGFKVTTNKSKDEQFLSALKMMKAAKCNLVLANDTVTRHNMIITPEETSYCHTKNRDEALAGLVDITMSRHDLTYTRTKFFEGNNVYVTSLPVNFQRVLKYLIGSGGFIENNGNGFTPGHFCYKTKDGEMISSQRKVNHNDVLSNGMTTVIESSNGDIVAIGSHKPSVGARSQLMLLKQFPQFNCVVHVHCPMKEGSEMPVVSQKEFQCGSLECGMNTVNNILLFNDGKIGAVMLDKHGPNIIFHSNTSFNEVIQFIHNNVELGTKIK